MGMGPAGVFILESPGVNELASGYSEGPIVSEMLKLLSIPYVLRNIESRQDLEREGRIFQQRHFDVLLISAHGENGAIQLTDGEMVSVAELFRLFKPSNKTTVLFSSCEVLGGDCWHEILQEDDVPDFVLGYETTIYWSSAALSSAMLLQALSTNQFASMLSALTSVYNCVGADVTGYVRLYDKEGHHWFSTKSFLEAAKQKYGSESDLEVSVLLSDYMKKEREEYKKRSDEYFQSMREMEIVNEEGRQRHAASHDAHDKLNRPASTTP